jgi:hypothetical protein
MPIDLHYTALDLLNILANSIHDRDPKITPPFFFSAQDIQILENWLSRFVNEIEKDCVCNKD